MIKYAKIINQETKECGVGLGTNTAFYVSVGMSKMDVEQAYNGNWYVKGYAPKEPKEDILRKEMQTQQNILSSTDWYAMRYADTGEAIPEEVKTKRQAARKRIDEIRAELKEL